MKKATAVVAVLAMALFAGAAIADMDYRCLNDCVNSGKTSNACMAQCSYGTRESTTKTLSLTGPMRSPHDQFTPPAPLNQIVLHSGRDPIASGKDYTCISQCQQGGHPYEYCEEQCINRATPSAQINATGGALTTPNPSSLINSTPPAGR